MPLVFYRKLFSLSPCLPASSQNSYPRSLVETQANIKVSISSCHFFPYLSYMSMQRISAECRRGVFLYCNDQYVPWSDKSYISRLSLLVLPCMHQSNKLQRVLSPVSGFFWLCTLRKGHGHGLWIYSSTLS
jgi:hypothetical protein